jgi:hypothetical protein
LYQTSPNSPVWVNPVYPIQHAAPAQKVNQASDQGNIGGDHVSPLTLYITFAALVTAVGILAPLMYFAFRTPTDYSGARYLDSCRAKIKELTKQLRFEEQDKSLEQSIAHSQILKQKTIAIHEKLKSLCAENKPRKKKIGEMKAFVSNQFSDDDEKTRRDIWMNILDGFDHASDFKFDKSDLSFMREFEEQMMTAVEVSLRNLNMLLEKSTHIASSDKSLSDKREAFDSWIRNSFPAMLDEDRMRMVDKRFPNTVTETHSPTSSHV